MPLPNFCKEMYMQLLRILTGACKAYLELVTTAGLEQTDTMTTYPWCSEHTRGRKALLEYHLLILFELWVGLFRGPCAWIEPSEGR